MSIGLSSAQAGGIAAGVIAFVGCVIALIVGVACYKNGVCKQSSPRPSQMRTNRPAPLITYPPATVGSSTMNNGYVIITPQFFLNATHQQQQPQCPYQLQHPASLTLEESSHLKEATTHAGEAPPAYHAAVHYQTMTLEDYETIKLSEASADNCAEVDLNGNTESGAPPNYSEVIGGQEENSVECDQNDNICSTTV